MSHLLKITTSYLDFAIHTNYAALPTPAVYNSAIQGSIISKIGQMNVSRQQQGAGLGNASAVGPALRRPLTKEKIRVILRDSVG